MINTSSAITTYIILGFVLFFGILIEAWLDPSKRRVQRSLFFSTWCILIFKLRSYFLKSFLERVLALLVLSVLIIAVSEVTRFVSLQNYLQTNNIFLISIILFMLVHFFENIAMNVQGNISSKLLQYDSLVACSNIDYSIYILYASIFMIKEGPYSWIHFLVSGLIIFLNFIFKLKSIPKEGPVVTLKSCCHFEKAMLYSVGLVPVVFKSVPFIQGLSNIYVLYFLLLFVAVMLFMALVFLSQQISYYLVSSQKLNFRLLVISLMMLAVQGIVL